jgi:hypothetical protein
MTAPFARKAQLVQGRDEAWIHGTTSIYANSQLGSQGENDSSLRDNKTSPDELRFISCSKQIELPPTLSDVDVHVAS